MKTKKSVKIIIIGAGSRGYEYSTYAVHHPDKAKIVAVAEPRKAYREKARQLHNLPEQDSVADWRELLNRDKFADAVIIATPDILHAEMAIAFADKGYDMLLEKPIAPTAKECRQVVEAVKRNNIRFGVCHVLRYTRYTKQLKALLDAGTIGDIVTIQHLESVGYWHQAHSYVRGNWRNEKESGFMLLTKSCHDIDWLTYIIGSPCKSVSSFGSLKHFRRENQPDGAADRCVDCAVESTCPYSALKIYIGRLNRHITGWPLDVLTPDVNEANIMTALQEGPYGRCVYACDNDTVDHQVVNMQFDGDVTATFTMTAFNEAVHRKTSIFGTKGEIHGDGSYFRHYDFLTNRTRMIKVERPEYSYLTGHEGGDFEMMNSVMTAFCEDKPELILAGAQETLDSHLSVFAAEKARLENRVVVLS